MIIATRIESDGKECVLYVVTDDGGDQSYAPIRPEKAKDLLRKIVENDFDETWDESRFSWIDHLNGWPEDTP